MNTSVSDIWRGVKVLDISSVLAGPQAGSFFAELGAAVVKVERKSTGGDATRTWKLPSEDRSKSVSAYYAAANTAKEVIMLDLDEAKDYAQLVMLVQEADIVISNYQRRVAEKLRVTPADLRHIKPELIVAQLVAYSYDDPRPGYDLVMQAETGWLAMTGTDERHLAKLPVALIDIVASHQIREAVLLGMIKRLKTGRGSTIHISLYKSAISALANQAANYLNENHLPQPMGTLHPNIAPYGDIFITKDKKAVILAVGSDEQFEKLGKTLNLAARDMATFQYNSDRVASRQLLHEVIQHKLKLSTLHNVAQSFTDANVPYCVIHNLKEVFTADLASSMILEENMEGHKQQKVSTIAFEFVD